MRDYLYSTTMFSLGEKILLYLPSPDVVGRVEMIPALMALGASFRQEDYCRNVQWNTASKTSAWYVNAHDAGSAYVGAASGDGHSCISIPYYGGVVQLIS